MRMHPAVPGIQPTWCSSVKDAVGCALGPSRLWFTIGGGIVNEVFYPRIDIPQIRDLGFIVADDQGFWVEVKRMDNYQLVWAAQGVPAIEIVHQHDRFTLSLRIAPDSPARRIAGGCPAGGRTRLAALCAARAAPGRQRAQQRGRSAAPIAAAAYCGRNKARLALRWPPWTPVRAMPGARQRRLCRCQRWLAGFLTP